MRWASSSQRATCLSGGLGKWTHPNRAGRMVVSRRSMDGATGLDRSADTAAILGQLQDIAGLTLACDLRDLRVAQRSGACSPRLSGVPP
jgi:hypothetical protein